jgi:hypothetical protein
MASKEWRQKNPEKARAASQRQREKSPEKALSAGRKYRLKRTPEQHERDKRASQAWHYKTHYGMTLDDYYKRLEAQGGHCALCPRTPDQERHGKLHVDHDHTTGRVRGLLCLPCNHALGILGDNEAGLLHALAYIRD